MGRSAAGILSAPVRREAAGSQHGQPAGAGRRSRRFCKFWLDLGVDGFREDVITFISKKEGLPDDHLIAGLQGHPVLQSRPAHPRVSAGVPAATCWINYDCMTMAEAPHRHAAAGAGLHRRVRHERDRHDDPVPVHVAADCLFTDYMPAQILACGGCAGPFPAGRRSCDGRGLERPVSRKPRPSRASSPATAASSTAWRAARCWPPCYLFLQGHAVHLSGAGDRHDELAAGQAPSMYEDVQTRNQHPDWPEEKRLALAITVPPGTRARTPVQWDRRRKRRVHHRESRGFMSTKIIKTSTSPSRTPTRTPC